MHFKPLFIRVIYWWLNHSIKHLDATAVMVNDHTAFRVDWMPFAGRKHSGYGVGGIGYTMHDMVQIKMAVINHLA